MSSAVAFALLVLVFCLVPVDFAACFFAGLALSVVFSGSVSVLEAFPGRDDLLDLRVLLAGGSSSDSDSSLGSDSVSSVSGLVFVLGCLCLVGGRPLLARGSGSGSDSISTSGSGWTFAGSVMALEVGCLCLPDVRLLAGGSGSDSGSTSGSSDVSGAASVACYIGSRPLICGL